MKKTHDLLGTEAVIYRGKKCLNHELFDQSWSGSAKGVGGGRGVAVLKSLQREN